MSVSWPLLPFIAAYVLNSFINISPVFSSFCVFLFLFRSNSQEAAPGADNLHPLPARRPGGSVRQNPVPGHLHAGGGGTENQLTWVQSPGKKKYLILPCVFL